MDGVMLTIDDNGVAHEYVDTYDIVIHCESEDEQIRVLAILEKAMAKVE